MAVCQGWVFALTILSPIIEPLQFNALGYYSSMSKNLPSQLKNTDGLMIKTDITMHTGEKIAEYR